MAEPYYKTYVETMHRLNLQGAEAMVYSALLFLCSQGPYKGSYQELADFSCCGVDETASRAVKKLISKGLIIKNTDGITLPQIVGEEPHIVGEEPQIVGEEPQIVGEEPQIVGEKPQIVAISKEKSTKKENIIKEKKESENYTTSPSPAKIFMKEDFIPPTWGEWWAFAKEKQMGLFEAQKSFSYYEMRGWKDVCKWKAALVYWDMKNKT